MVVAFSYELEAATSEIILEVNTATLYFFDTLRPMYPAAYLRALPSLLDNEAAVVGSVVVAMLYSLWMNNSSRMSVRL